MHDITDVVILKSRPAIKTGLTFYLLRVEIIRIAFSSPLNYPTPNEQQSVIHREGNMGSGDRCVM
ncbi:hypothetical protein BJK05_18365 [Pectobacterium polaris]|uniref:hypothetical protein n=1 Tax=Pectobacterium polaris TaxID=2042057 RepID=UPI000BAC7778|nr:hypothetical protein [Pectobacterium polaris]ASY81838.1 hypothetical protein BJK05_18365 [Pectobacterium polaris]MCL6361090.1 hypothetical protein [Pectobacterium polaris]